jgi:hypothetical protein
VLENRNDRSFERCVLGKQYFKHLIFFTVPWIAAYRDFATLFGSSAAVGLDGYYYVIQVDALARGALFFPSHTPLVLYFLSALQLPIGNSIIAIKIGVIILEILLCLGVGGLLVRTTGSWWLGSVGVAYAAFAGLHFFMIGEFVSNLGGLAFFVATLFCFQSARQSSRRWWWLVTSLLFFLMALGSHRSSLLLLAGLCLAAGFILALRQAISKRNWWALIAISIALLGIYFSPYLALIQPFIALPQRLTEELSLRPRWPVTIYTVFDVISILLAAPSILVITIKEYWKRGTDRIHPVFPSLALVSLLLNLNLFVKPDLIAYGVIGRLQMLAYLQVALLVPYAVWLFAKKKRSYGAYASAFSIPLLIFGAGTKLPPGLQPDYLKDREKLIGAARTAVKNIPPDSIIVAAHGDEFVVTSVTGVSSQHSRPTLDKAAPIYWLLAQLPPDFDEVHAVPVGGSTDGLRRVLIRDDDFWPVWDKIGSLRQRRILLNNLPLKQYIMHRDDK